MIKRLIFIASLSLIAACATLTLWLPPASGQSSKGNRGTVTANSGTVGANAYYAAAGGSTVVSPDPTVTENGAGTLTVGLSGTAGGTLALAGSTSGTSTFTCDPTTTCVTGLVTTKSIRMTNVTPTGHLNQSAGNNFAGSCTQSSGTCTWTLNTAYVGTPLCAPFKVSGTVTGTLWVTVSTTTITINDTVTTDTGVTGAICVGNAN